MAFDEENLITEPSLSQTPHQRLARNDVHFPLTTPRKRNPAIPLLSHAATEDGSSTTAIPRLRTAPIPSVSSSTSQTYPCNDLEERLSHYRLVEPDECSDSRARSFRDLPEEIQNHILDHIFGDMRSVNATASSTGLSHRMRHPRRKAVSEIALLSRGIRVLVQKRVYRHIKIKATQDGLKESSDWFSSHRHLAKHVRHIEYWVPVWGDKAAVLNNSNQLYNAVDLTNAFGEVGHDFPGIQFKLSKYSATLALIFDHLATFFPSSSIFTLEGGHCKNSNMIKHFNSNLFDVHLKKSLHKLPNIRVFAMRGAWNIMRNYRDWDTIQEALPCLTELHCGYAKPRPEAYNTISDILLTLSNTLRHVEISLDSMFSKDDPILGSSPDRKGSHVCEQLGYIAPRLESLSFTGKVCSCFWSSLVETARRSTARTSLLKSLNLVVKNCCRQRIKTRDPITGDVSVHEIGGIMADSAGISNLVFISAFERLVLGAIDGVATMPSLAHVKMRYIDLDSPCQQLNPYWNLERGIVTGVWNDRIVESLAETGRGYAYEECEAGIRSDDDPDAAKKDDDVFSWHTHSVLAGPTPPSGASALYPKMMPKSINTASYKIIAEARAAQ